MLNENGFHSLGIAAPRFATQEDAKLYLRCCTTGEPYPPEKWIHPFETVDGVDRYTQAYQDAPYELGLIMHPHTEKILAEKHLPHA